MIIDAYKTQGKHLNKAYWGKWVALMKEEEIETIEDLEKCTADYLEKELELPDSLIRNIKTILRRRREWS